MMKILQSYMYIEIEGRTRETVSSKTVNRLMFGRITVGQV